MQRVQRVCQEVSVCLGLYVEHTLEQKLQHSFSGQPLLGVRGCGHEEGFPTPTGKHWVVTSFYNVPTLMVLTLKGSLDRFFGTED